MQESRLRKDKAIHFLSLMFVPSNVKLLGLSKSSFGRQVQVLFILILGSAISRNTTFVTHSKLYYTPGLIGSQNILYVKILVKTNKTYCTVKSSKISFAKLMTIMCSTFYRERFPQACTYLKGT